MCLVLAADRSGEDFHGSYRLALYDIGAQWGQVMQWFAIGFLVDVCPADIFIGYLIGRLLHTEGHIFARGL